MPFALFAEYLLERDPNQASTNSFSNYANPRLFTGRRPDILDLNPFTIQYDRNGSCDSETDYYDGREEPEPYHKQNGFERQPSGVTGVPGNVEVQVAGNIVRRHLGMVG